MRPFLAAVVAAAVLTSAGLAGAASSKPPDPAKAQKVAALVAQLKDRDPKVRIAAAQELRRAVPWGPRDEMGTAMQAALEKAVDPLIAALKDPEVEVRSVAAMVLGQTGNRRAFDPLVAAMRDKEERIRQAVTGAISRILGSRAVEWFATALKHSDPKVRAAAAEAIAMHAAERARAGRLGDPLGKPFTAAVGPLIAALDDEEAEVRWNAVYALDHIGDPRAAEPLIARLRDRDTEVRDGAAGALGDLALRGADMDAAVEPLAAAMRAPPFVSGAAAQSLGMIGGPRATDALLAAASDPSPGMRGHAVSGLGWVARVGTSDGRVKGAILAALEDAGTSVRRSAAETLAWLGDRRAVRPLLAMMEAGDERTRYNAMVSLSQLLRGPRTGLPGQPSADEYACERLYRRVDRIAFADKPLKDVLSYIGRQAGISLHAQWRGLEAIGVKPEAKVTVDLSNVTLGAALWNVLAQVDASDRVGCRIREGVLVVSTEADLRAAARDAGKVPGADTPKGRELLELLKRRVGLDFEKVSVQDVLRYLSEVIRGLNSVVVDWKALKAAGVEPATPLNLKLRQVQVSQILRLVLDDVAGTGKLGFSVADGVLFISTAADLRAYAARDWRKVPGADTPNGQAVMGRLEQPVDLDFEAASIDNVFKYLNAVCTRLNIVADWAALEKAGCSASATVTLKVRRVPTGRFLALVLDLAYGQGKVAFSVEKGYVHVQPAAGLGLTTP